MAISATVDPPPRRGRCGSVPAACLRSLAGARRSSRVLTAALTGRPIRHEAWSRWSRRGDSNPEPSAYKNSGTGRSGWLPLVRLTTPLSTLDVVPAADRVSGTASGTDCPQWPELLNLGEVPGQAQWRRGAPGTRAAGRVDAGAPAGPAWLGAVP